MLPACAPACEFAASNGCMNFSCVSDRSHDATGSCIFRPCDASCSFGWLPTKALAKSVSRYSWLLFVGDSDTRGIVLALLQTLAEAATSRAVAMRTPAMWGLSNTSSGEGDVARICYLDWTFDRYGQVHAMKHVRPCKMGDPHNLRDASRGANYTISSGSDGAPPEGGFRVTFMMATLARNTALALEGVVETLMHRTSLRPDFIYANFGAWLAAEPINPLGVRATELLSSRLLQSIRRLGELNANATKIWGTNVGHRTVPKARWENALDMGAFRWLANPASVLRDPDWLILNRTDLSGRLLKKQIVYLTTGHMPHLVNMLDLQRIFATVHVPKQTSPPLSDPPPLVIRDGGDGCKLHAAESWLRFAPWCHGRKHVLERTHTQSWTFLCSVDVERNGIVIS